MLTAALALSAPGEYRLALLAGWTPPFAAVMPLVMSLYAGVAAAIASSLTKGSPERRQANVGAVLALLLAMTAQVIAHLIEAGYLVKGPAVVVAVSAVPPLVAAHTLHLAGVTVMRPVVSPEPVPPTVNLSRTSAPPWKPAVIKAMPALPPPTVKAVSTALTPRPEVVTARVPEEPEKASESPQKPSADEIVRRLYDELRGRPATRHIRQALADASLPNSDGSCRQARLRVEQKEPELKELPPA
ncbi:hypothetical protein A4E84_29835 [Streptomyces qaidamensis]|uniref:DUF2637 domain-containing protein n=1 Tax=Streptomyces qaidamensis TaxID=1783515 RepID=A0A143C7Z4_9ACTN|nr:hypothetical protein A4E84_29835 [Streptomyces qaidamensis]